MPKILLIDDDEVFHRLLSEELGHHGYEVEWRQSAEDSPDMLSATEAGLYGVLLLDNKLPGKKGTEFLKELRQQGVQTPVILITGHGTTDVEIEAWKLGVFQFFTKPDHLDGRSLEPLRRALGQAVEASRLMQEPVLPPDDPRTEGTRLSGECGREPMSEVYKLMGNSARAASRDHPVLFTGETGTGKEMFARALFHQSDRNKGPFLKVRCAASGEKELEEELFGYEGSDRRKIGAFEKAHGGAVLLDDLGGTSGPVQAKVLQVIKDGFFIRGGSGTKVETDVWVIACALRKFDSELYYQFTKIPLPPLRKREEDIDLLANYFLAQVTAQQKKPLVQSISEQARKELHRYEWPGNVRELQQAICTAVILCRGTQITPGDLKLDEDSTAGEIKADLQRAVRTAAGSDQPGLFPLLKGILERELVHHIWTTTGGSEEKTAERTGLPLSDVQKMLRDGIGIPGPGGEPPKKLSRSREKAWELYKWALGREPTLAVKTDAEVFAWLKAKSQMAKEEGLEGLPKSPETFERYMRQARAYHNCPKNTPTHHRPVGKSVVRPDQIA